MRFLKLGILTAFLLAVSAGSGLAHEFFVVPEEWHTYTVGQSVPVSAFSTHVFIRGEELEPAGYTELGYLGKKLPLSANENRLTYDSKVTLEGPGAAIITGHRLPMLYSQTPKGGADGGRDVNPDATKVTLYEKFAKLILPVGGKADGYNKVAGQRLEIIPMSDIATAKVGDEISFRVLLDGKPAMFDMVYATYSGFSDIPSAWAFCASPVAHGEARVKLTAAGLWNVRVTVQLDEKGKNYDAVDLKSILTFPVK